MIRWSPLTSLMAEQDIVADDPPRLHSEIQRARSSSSLDPDHSGDFLNDRGTLYKGRRILRLGLPRIRGKRSMRSRIIP